FMIFEQITDARIAVVIGHTGRNFVSSTDWRLTTESGAHRILPFSVRPQYPNFVECVAGVSYEVKNGKFCITPDSICSSPKATDMIHEKGAVVKIGGKNYRFKPGEAIKIYVEPNSRFIATDCKVVCTETKSERIFELMPDEETKWGFLDDAENVSQAM
ncbi:MAG: hypothetical protein IKR60_02115, partial [Alphaproteobacteria bacterium]|nr:hypothetical protein [Alphaproteobacteria bacterium]